MFQRTVLRRIGVALFLTIMFVAAGLSMFNFFTGAAESRGAAESPKLDAYAAIFRFLERDAYHDYTEEEFTKLHECILERAAFTIKIPKGETLEEDVTIESCFADDPYASYVSEETYEDLYATIHKGEYAGVGVTVSPAPEGEGVIVEEIMAGGAAEESGLLAKGDRIIAAGEESGSLTPLHGLSMKEIVGRIRGPVGTQITLEIVRANEHLFVTLTRREVLLETAKADMLEEGIGLLRIIRFWEEDITERKVAPRLEWLANQGTRALVIDLRGNPGGFLDEVLSTYNFFSPAAGRPLIELRERGSLVSETEHSARRSEYADWKIAVLVDANSASASEILARLLQLDGARVLGEQTYGKGSAQVTKDVAGSGRFSFTTSMYYFAETGETIEGIGVMPDVETDRPFERALEYLRGELAKQ